jgi:hypothetical protein
MFKSLQIIYTQLKSFVKYISNRFTKKEKVYYDELSDDDIRSILF